MTLSGSGGPETAIAGRAGVAPRDHHAEIFRDDLTAILVEIKALLSSDTAVLLLVDSTGRILVPAASSGIDRTGRAAMRIPIGRGFAGRVAETRQPVVLDEVTASNVINPLLREHGLHSMLGVPVTLDGRLLGVLHVGSLAPRGFTPNEVQLLERAAERLAVAVRDRRTTEEQTAALVLQRSLLPDVLPEIIGLDLAARYIPADGDFGGDWYDVFRLPEERIGVVMGDVAGHGLHPSVVMGRLRSALRAYALDYRDPAEVLHHLDLKINHFEPEAMATVLYGVSAAPYDRFLFSAAGHPGPLIATPGRATYQLGIRPDPPLGVAPDHPRHSTQLELSIGTTLCLFTDGLVERRPGTENAADQFSAGLERAMGALEAGRTEDAEATTTRIIEATLGDDPAEDDVALLTLRRLARQ